jgi:hypothetical protein
MVKSGHFRWKAATGAAMDRAFAHSCVSSTAEVATKLSSSPQRRPASESPPHHASLTAAERLIVRVSLTFRSGTAPEVLAGARACMQN